MKKWNGGAVTLACDALRERIAGKKIALMMNTTATDNEGRLLLDVIVREKWAEVAFFFGMLCNWVELQFFHYSHFLCLADGQSYSHCIWAVDEFAYIVNSYCESYVLAIAIEVARNEVLIAESFSCFLAVLATWSTCQFKNFHFFIKCYSIIGQNSQPLILD